MKRFYKDVSVSPLEEGWEVHLDERPVKTPNHAILSVPTMALAEAIAEEWRAQEEDVIPDSMPLTRLANTAVDRVAEMPETIIGEISSYAANDLICYRAEVPPELIEAQSAAWDPYIHWAEGRFSERPKITSGIVHIEQAEVLIADVSEVLSEKDAFVLAAIHNLTTLLGSAFIAIALSEDAASADTAWDASRVDEIFQQARWGADEDAAAKSAADKALFLAAARFIELLGP